MQKKSQSRKYAVIILISAVLISGGTFFALHFKWHRPEKLVVTNLDVGKADSAVIEYGDIVGLIDTGTSDAFGTIDHFLDEKGITEIDYMILTHYDKDHIGSATEIMESFDVDNIYLPDYESEKKFYESLMEAVKDRDGVVFVSDPLSFSYDDLEIEILPAEDPEELLEIGEKIDNNMSLVCMMTYGRNDLLFTGDIEKERIKQMVKSAEDGDEVLDCDWIKIPHHGKYQKKEKDLLNITTPQYAVISTSEEEPPEDELMELLNKKNIENFDTADGNVVTVCDSAYITVEIPGSE